MKIVLIGQPNSGKSTIFNIVAGYRSISSNFPGATVKYNESRVRLNGIIADIVDFPGCYCLSSSTEIEQEIRDYLLTQDIDVIINVLDASQLDRGLPLTMELLEYNISVVIGLNMVDEAEASGFSINSEKLATILGVPVIETVAAKDKGIAELFKVVRGVAGKRIRVKQKVQYFQRDVENVVEQLALKMQEIAPPEGKISNRYMAIKLLEGDQEFFNQQKYQKSNGVISEALQLQNTIAQIRGKSADTVIMLERHAIAQEIISKVVTFHTPTYRWKDRVDNIFLHPIWGYIVLISVIIGMFYTVFGIGSSLETILLQQFESVESYLRQNLHEESLLFIILQGGLAGISGGIAIVLPYLIPFLFILSLLEDAGYLPRVAFLLDSFMHKIGLHGTAVMPVLLGYGCSVPAIMATRILPDKRDKIIAAMVTTLVPCSARSVVILGLVAFYLGAPAAMALYVLNIIIIAITGKFFSKLMPSLTPGMILEMPQYQMPVFKTVLRKVWFRIKEFVMIAWPLLILGSIVLGIADYFQWHIFLNSALSPLTGLIGLPEVVGITLIFGVLRKELSLIMLVQALGTTNILAVLTPGQIMSFTVFVMFYIPCIATIGVLITEIGWRWAASVTLMTLGLAILLALATRGAFIIF